MCYNCKVIIWNERKPCKYEAQEKPPHDPNGLARMARRILIQERNSKDKVYSVHEPQVECIAKGDPYNGHTLEPIIGHEKSDHRLERNRLAKEIPMKKVNVSRLFSFDTLAGLMLVVLYTPVFIQLYQFRWNNIDYSHAYIVLPVSLGLAFYKHREIRAALAGGSAAGDMSRGLALVILAALMFVFGWRMQFGPIVTMSLIPMLFGIILYRFNAGLARVLMFPILYLLLLVPPPLGILDAITLPMRYLISTMAASLMGVFLPVQQDGMMIYVGTARIYVGAPCSGFRSIVTMFALALVYVHLIKMEWVKKLILLASVVPLAMFGNLIRVIVLSLITFFFGKEAGEGFFHNFSGMVIFFIMTAGLMWIVKILEGDGRDGYDDA